MLTAFVASDLCESTGKTSLLAAAASAKLKELRTKTSSHKSNLMQSVHSMSKILKGKRGARKLGKRARRVQQLRLGKQAAGASKVVEVCSVCGTSSHPRPTMCVRRTPKPDLGAAPLSSWTRLCEWRRPRPWNSICSRAFGKVFAKQPRSLMAVETCTPFAWPLPSQQRERTCRPPLL